MKIVQSGNSPKNKVKANTSLAIACVFCLTVAFYLLSFSAIPISDDEELYASVARNLVISGKISAEQLYGNLRLVGNYHGVEPAFPALASLWYRLFLHTDFGHLQSLYLLPILYTGLSAALITFIAFQLNYPNRIGAVAGILFGLSTMAWPYAKTLFREPLISLLLLLSLSVFIALTAKRNRTWSTLLLAVALLFLIILLFLTKVVMIITALAFLISIAFMHPNIKKYKEPIFIITVCSFIIFLGLFLYLFSPKVTDANIFYRFSNTFLHDAIAILVHAPHTHLWEALFAPLVSPWKGLLFYSPVCLLGPISFVKYGRKRPELFILPIIILITLLLQQALVYDSKWWTPTWGSRFLVPAIPLMITASLPVIEELSNRKKGWVVLGCLFIIGFLIQLPAIFFNSAEFTATAYLNEASFPRGLIWSIINTPVITQWQSILTQKPDLLLWRTANMHPALALVIVIMAFGLITASITYLHKARTDYIIYKGHIGLFLGLSAALVALISVSVLRIGGFDPAYHSQEFQPMCAYINENIKSGELMIIQPYPGPVWQYLMNYECGQKTWYSLPYNENITSSPAAVQLLSTLTAQNVSPGSGIWFIGQFWSKSFVPETDGMPLHNYDLTYAKYFYNSFYIFVGYYTSK
jgi:hypothetical protein